MLRTRFFLICLFGLISVTLSRVIENADNSSSSEESRELEEVVDELKSLCLKKSGTNDTFDNLELQFALLPMCVASKIDMDGISEGLENLSSEAASRAEFFGRYCPQVQDSLSCLDPLATELRKCLDQEGIEIVDIFINMLPEALQLVCKNDGEILFSEDGFTTCGDQISGYVDKCTDLISNTTEAMDLSNYGKKQCDELSATRECMVGKLDECKGSRWLELFDLFYRPIVKASPCKTHIKLDEVNLIESNHI